MAGTYQVQPLFSRLLRLANRRPPKVAVRDVRRGWERSHLDILADVLALRERIVQTIAEDVQERIRNGDEIYIAVLAPGGYEYTVAVLAVLALGAAVVPVSVVVPVNEAAYFIRKSNSVAVLACTKALALGSGLEELINSTTDPAFRSIAIEPSLFGPPMLAREILISSDRYLDDNGPGVVIFTSGTTGPPKGSVMRRAFTYDFARSVADHYQLNEDDVILHVLPVHHATGIGIMFFPFLICGACIEFRSGSFDEGWLWERWREGAIDPKRRITFFSGVPTIYMRMRRHYQHVLSKLSPACIAEYVAGARQFRAVLCGTSALPRPIAEFWNELLQDQIVQRYGATEFGAVFKVHLGDTEVPDGSVGELVAGIDLKLTDGDEGELLVKSPHMFSKYLGDAEATAQAHDENGYFKTGDIVRREGKYYFITGRASMDIIKSGGYKISALDIEREILALPYVSEVMIVGVSDEEFGQRVAAAISLQEQEITEEFLQTHSDGKYILTLGALRRDLRSRLAGYKLPTMLKVIEGDFPRTPSGKVLKKILGPQYFPEAPSCGSDVQIFRPPVRIEIQAKL